MLGYPLALAAGRIRLENDKAAAAAARRCSLNKLRQTAPSYRNNILPSLFCETNAQLNRSSASLFIAGCSSILDDYRINNVLPSSGKLVASHSLLLPGATNAFQQFLIVFPIIWLISFILQRKRRVRKTIATVCYPWIALFLALQKAGIPQCAHAIDHCPQGAEHHLAGGFGQSNDVSSQLGYYARGNQGQQLQQFGGGGAQGSGGVYQGGANDTLMPSQTPQYPGQEEPHEHLDCPFRAHPDERFSCTRSRKHFDGFRSIADLQAHLNKQHGLLYCTSCLLVEIHSATAWRKHNHPTNCHLRGVSFPENFKSDWPGWGQIYPSFEHMKNWTDLVHGNAQNLSVEERWRAIYSFIFNEQPADQVNYRYLPPPRARATRAGSEASGLTPLRPSSNNAFAASGARQQLSSTPLTSSPLERMWHLRDGDSQSVTTESDRSTVFSRHSQPSAHSTQPSSQPLLGAQSSPGYLPPSTSVRQSPWQPGMYEGTEQLMVSASDQGFSPTSRGHTSQHLPTMSNTSAADVESIMQELGFGNDPYVALGLGTFNNQTRGLNPAPAPLPAVPSSSGPFAHNPCPPNSGPVTSAQLRSSGPFIDAAGGILREVLHFSTGLAVYFDLEQFPNRDQVPSTALPSRERELLQEAAAFLHRITSPERLVVLRQSFEGAPT